MSLFGVILPKDPTRRRTEARLAVLHQAAKIGGTVFGPVPKGNRREFFCLDRRTWVWHEEWTDKQKVRHARTTRYDIRPHGVFKAQDGQPYQPLSHQEAVNFYYAVEAYEKAVSDYFLPQIAASVH